LEAILIQIISDEQIRVVIPRHNFLIKTCSSCKKRMLLSEGDVIYGDKWYHNSCWSLVEQNNTEHNISKN